MFGKFIVNSHDWLTLQNYFQAVCPQIVNHYLSDPIEHPKLWASKPQDLLNVYSAVYNLCVAKQSRNERIYAFYHKMLEEFIYLCICQIKTREETNPLSPIQAEVSLWEAYSELLKICNKAFAYLDRYYARDSHVESIKTKALTTLESAYLGPNRVIHIIKEVICEIGDRRKQFKLGDDNIFKISTMFKTISSVTGSSSYNLLNQSVNELSSKYYRRLGEVWSEEMPERFMDNLLRFLEYEEKVYKLILPEEDSMQFNPRFESEMVPKLVPILMKHEQGLKMFFRQERIEYLNRIFYLLKRFNSTEELKKFYYSYIRGLGFQLFERFKNEEDQSVKRILLQFSEFYNHIWNLTNRVFDSAPQFQIEFRKAMEIIIHLHDEDFNIAWRLVEAINNHFSSDPTNKDIQPVLTMFDCLTSKDIFIGSYQQDLTHRLLSNNCKYLAEQIKFIEGLKQKCGENFTELIELKIRDYLAAIELNRQFEVERIKSEQQQLQFSIKVLSKRSWTLENKPNQDYFPYNIAWPKELIPIKQQFQSFYNQNNQSKHIDYLPLLSTTLLSIKYKGEVGKMHTHEIKTNLLQASIIIFIEGSKIEVSEGEILTQFGIIPEILNSQIKIFTVGTNPMLVLGQNGYKFNDAFNPMANELNVQIPNLRKNSKTQTSSVDRELAIQAVVIKILKSNGKQQFDSLVEEVKLRLKFFKPSLSKIKEALEKLIERDFIQREAEQLNVFVYKA